MFSEMRFHQRFVNPMARIIEIHRDLFEDHFLFSLKILGPDRRPHQVRKMLEERGLTFTD